MKPQSLVICIHKVDIQSILSWHMVDTKVIMIMAKTLQYTLFARLSLMGFQITRQHCTFLMALVMYTRFYLGHFAVISKKFVRLGVALISIHVDHIQFHNDRNIFIHCVRTMKMFVSEV